MAVTNQVFEILRQVDEARLAREEHCKRLLKELAPILQESKKSSRERQEAPRFNSFKYLRDDEIGLSSVIADLLDPHAEHGQGTTFLEAMLEVLPDPPGWLSGLHPATADSIHVTPEHWIPDGGGRIDITVEISSAMGYACLAFENKPYASDLDRQIITYLRYLHKQYGKHFMLVYLPPVNRWPGENSFPRAERENWREHFCIMPYIDEDASVEKWLATCLERCDAERVRSFLKDAQMFCKQQFGEKPMSKNPDVLFVRDYLSANPSQLSAALAIHDAWIPVRDTVCKRFLEYLREAVNDRIRDVLTDVAPDCNVWCNYEGERLYSNGLWISRDNWAEYDEIQSSWNTRAKIGLSSRSQGPNGWIWGVNIPKPVGKMSEEERRRREDISIALERHGLRLPKTSDWWLQYAQIPRYQDWDPIASQLAKEYEAGGGPITEFYVDRLLNIAPCAIPAINEIEMVNRASSSE
ncbi:MAG: PD-(D/E)XK nuclease family protein [Bacteroidota bacterium]|nr:PD-(D/E)XK nuclease family protein [Bacteroidota bacterium]